MKQSGSDPTENAAQVETVSEASTCDSDSEIVEDMLAQVSAEFDNALF